MLSLDTTHLPTLTTPRLILREVLPSDAQAVFSMRSDPRVMRHIPRPRAISLQDAIDHIRVIREEFAKGEMFTWAITLHGDPTFIGIVTLLRLKKEHHRTEIGYLLGFEQWGRSFMSEAVGAVVEHAFAVMNFHSIEAIADALNTGSLRVLEKNGFLREAYFKEDSFHNGVYNDSVVYSKLNPRHA